MYFANRHILETYINNVYKDKFTDALMDVAYALSREVTKTMTHQVRSSFFQQVVDYIDDAHNVDHSSNIVKYFWHYHHGRLKLEKRDNGNAAKSFEEAAKIATFIANNAKKNNHKTFYQKEVKNCQHLYGVALEDGLEGIPNMEERKQVANNAIAIFQSLGEQRKMASVYFTLGDTIRNSHARNFSLLQQGIEWYENGIAIMKEALTKTYGKEFESWSYYFYHNRSNFKQFPKTLQGRLDKCFHEKEGLLGFVVKKKSEQTPFINTKQIPPSVPQQQQSPPALLPISQAPPVNLWTQEGYTLAQILQAKQQGIELPQYNRCAKGEWKFGNLAKSLAD